jgi:hypothetical protein
MTGRLIPPNPPCPKCKSYMFMPRSINRVYYRLCKVCGYKSLDGNKKLSWDAIKIYLERFWFWKS